MFTPLAADSFAASKGFCSIKESEQNREQRPLTHALHPLALAETAVTG